MMMLLPPLKLTSCSSSLLSLSSSLSITSSSSSISSSINRLMTIMTAAAPATTTATTTMITTVSTTKTKATFLSTLSLSLSMNQHQQQKHERILLSTTTMAKALSSPIYYAFYSNRLTIDNNVFVVASATNNFNSIFGGSSSTSKRLMSTSSTTTDKNSKGEEQEKEQEEQPSGDTITGSITFAAETDEEYLSKEVNEQSVDGGIDINNIDYSLYTEPIIIEMPQLDDVGGDTTNCYIDEWYKKEGDIIYSGDVICDISSPDFIFGMQIDDDGTGILKKIHLKENIKVPDHTPICTIYYKKKLSKLKEK